MYCSNCGKENADSDLFCTGCGSSLKGNSSTTESLNNIVIEQNAPPKSKKKKWICIVAIIAVIIVIIKIFGSDNAEYTNNAGNKLPIVVNQVLVQDAFSTEYTDISVDVENITDTDYRTVNLAVLAWDSKGLPVELCGMYDFFGNSYVNYLELENISSKAADTYTFTFESADIEYISVFLDECEDFDGNKWENPFMKDIENYQGKKLEDMDIYYFSIIGGNHE